MKRKTNTVLALGFVCSLFVLTAGKCNQTSNPPNGIDANLLLGSQQYLCDNGSPIYLMDIGKGKVKLSVTSNVAPQFTWSREYVHADRLTWYTPLSGCTNLKVPDKDGYTITGWYNELPSSTCIPPAGLCYRWFRQVDIPAKYKPSCSNNDVLYINMINPSGFTGGCNF